MRAVDPSEIERYWQLPAAELLARLGSGARGLSVREAAARLHRELSAQGVDVVLDDRGERPGVMFADMELIGIPHRIVIGERGLNEGKLEYKSRLDVEPTLVDQSDIIELITGKLCAG